MKTKRKLLIYLTSITAIFSLILATPKQNTKTVKADDTDYLLYNYNYKYTLKNNLDYHQITDDIYNGVIETGTITIDNIPLKTEFPALANSQVTASAYQANYGDYITITTTKELYSNAWRVTFLIKIGMYEQYPYLSPYYNRSLLSLQTFYYTDGHDTDYRDPSIDTNNFITTTKINESSVIYNYCNYLQLQEDQQSTINGLILQNNNLTLENNNLQNTVTGQQETINSKNQQILEYQNTITSQQNAITALQDANDALQPLDITGLMYDTASLPFDFISHGFNLTLFPDTDYEINIENILLGIFSIAVLFFVFKIIKKLI